MRISDWSSDVCSSDLHATAVADLADETLGQVDRRHGVGEEQLADFGQRRAAGALVIRAFDAGIDEQQVEGFVLELLAQGDAGRSEERWGGKECASPCRSRW